MFLMKKKTDVTIWVGTQGARDESAGLQKRERGREEEEIFSGCR
jgi:hypothetical protein